MSYTFASLPQQPKRAAPGDAVPLAEFGSGHPRVLGHHALDYLDLQPPADPPFAAMHAEPALVSRRIAAQLRRNSVHQRLVPLVSHVPAGH